MRKVLIATFSTGALLATAGSASAATYTTPFNVTATVVANCLASASNLAFGNYTPGAGAVPSNTTISVRCTKGTPYTVLLNAGTTTGGTLAQRLMLNGAANTLQYNLYTTAGFGTVFGDGTGGTGTGSGTGNGVALASAQTVTVFGNLPDNATNQNAVLGAYSDTITVTISY